MKINRLLSAALITLATVLTGCVKESVWDVKTGIDESKAAPEDFNYDENMSSNNSLTVYWNGQKAKAAGAKSFLVQLTDPDNMDKGDTWNTKVTKVLEITDDETANYESATFSGLTEYDCYYVRIRANYPGSVYSPWVYVTKEDGSPALMQVGHGAMAQVPVVALEALVTDINVSWTKCEGAVKYYVEWKKASESTWNKSADLTDITYTISGLADNTEYEVKVTSVTADNSYTSEVAKAKTNEKPPFPMDIATAAEWINFVTGEFIGLANNGADDVVNLTADLDFTGVEYPAGVEFKGLVNGNGKTIKNLTTAVPLFKSVTSAKDLTFDATCALTSTTAGKFAMLAEVSTGLVSNVTNNGKVTMDINEAPGNTDAIIAAGIVAEADADIVNCHNNGEITINSAEGLEASLAAGICGYAATKVTDCTNSGKVSQNSTHMIAAFCTYKGIAKVPQHTGGIVAMTKKGSLVENCTNTGNIILNMSEIEKITSSVGTNRVRIAGIVGAARGDIKGCTNKGQIECYARTSTRDAMTTLKDMNYSVSPGGITGGMMDYGSAEDVGMNVTDCVNEGDIIVDADVNKNNSTVGGIVSHPGFEDASNTNTIENCINRGNITVTGAGKFRVAGINGGMANVLGCENYGTIKFATNSKGKNSGSCVAGISGYMGKNLKHENNKNFGDIIEDTELVHCVAGLIANWNNLKATYGVGCVVNCNVTTKSSLAKAGMVGGYGENAEMQIGTAEAPVKVSGTFNGTAINAGNVATTALGSSAKGIMNVVFGE